MSKAGQLRDDIAANRVPGGSAFGRAAAEFIALNLEAVPPSEPYTAAQDLLEGLCDWLVATKPSMASVRNVVQIARVASQRDELATKSDRVATIARAMRLYIQQSEQALRHVANGWPSVVSEGRKVLAHSYSGSMEALFQAAASAGTSFSLLLTESRPYRESRRLAESLTGFEIPISLYSDAAVAVAAASADVALLGADTVFRDGSFANKTGSLPLALACRRAGVPLYVATELSKVYLGPPEDIDMELRPPEELWDGWELAELGRVTVWNQFFERVDSEFVQGYITERGPLQPSDMSAAASAELLLPPAQSANPG
jgi:translation initiation factor 2B subunit (eIF-2B alpha/beta/delta family)